MMNLTVLEIHDISVIVFASALVLLLYSLFSDVKLIALILFLVVLAITLM